MRLILWNIYSRSRRNSNPIVSNYYQYFAFEATSRVGLAIELCPWPPLVTTDHYRRQKNRKSNSCRFRWRRFVEIRAKKHSSLAGLSLSCVSVVVFLWVASRRKHGYDKSADLDNGDYSFRSPKIEAPAQKFINTLCQWFGNEHHTPSEVLFLFVNSRHDSLPYSINYSTGSTRAQHAHIVAKDRAQRVETEKGLPVRCPAVRRLSIVVCISLTVNVRSTTSNNNPFTT